MPSSSKKKRKYLHWTDEMVNSLIYFVKTQNKGDFYRFLLSGQTKNRRYNYDINTMWKKVYNQWREVNTDEMSTKVTKKKFIAKFKRSVVMPMKLKKRKVIEANQTKKMEYKRDFSSFKRKASKTGGGRNPPLPPELGGSDFDTESDGEQNFKGSKLTEPNESEDAMEMKEGFEYEYCVSPPIVKNGKKQHFQTLSFRSCKKTDTTSRVKSVDCSNCNINFSDVPYEAREDWLCYCVKEEIIEVEDEEEENLEESIDMRVENEAEKIDVEGENTGETVENREMDQDENGDKRVEDGDKGSNEDGDKDSDEDGDKDSDEDGDKDTDEDGDKGSDEEESDLEESESDYFPELHSVNLGMIESNRDYEGTEDSYIEAVKKAKKKHFEERVNKLFNNKKSKSKKQDINERLNKNEENRDIERRKEDKKRISQSIKESDKKERERLAKKNLLAKKKKLLADEAERQEQKRINQQYRLQKEKEENEREIEKKKKQEEKRKKDERNVEMERRNKQEEKKIKRLAEDAAREEQMRVKKYYQSMNTKKDNDREIEMKKKQEEKRKKDKEVLDEDDLKDKVGRIEIGMAEDKRNYQARLYTEKIKQNQEIHEKRLRLIEKLGQMMDSNTCTPRKLNCLFD